MRRRVAPVIFASLALALAGCGGGGEDDGGAGGANGDGNGAGSAAAGEAVFADAGCGGCHVLEAAGSSGSVGPNLDESQPSRDQVEQMVRSGGGAMPAFEGQLTDEEIAAVAEYVSSNAGG